jgi:hypothetical protein
MSETITCPSGLSGRIRGMKAREDRILADRMRGRSVRDNNDHRRVRVRGSEHGLLVRLSCRP